MIEIIKPVITPEMIQRAFNGEVIQILPSPGPGYHYTVQKDGTVLKRPDIEVVYD